MSDASGCQSNLTSKWARAMLYTFGEIFEKVSHENSQTHCSVIFPGVNALDDKCKKGEMVKLVYDDATGHIRVIMQNPPGGTANPANKVLMLFLVEKTA